MEWAPVDGVVQGDLWLVGESGTLARRFASTAVAGRAKTGSLDGVAAVVGYADTNACATLSFTYVVNGAASPAAGRWLQDALAGALVRSATGGPSPPTTGGR